MYRTHSSILFRSPLKLNCVIRRFVSQFSFSVQLLQLHVYGSLFPSSLAQVKCVHLSHTTHWMQECRASFVQIVHGLWGPGLRSIPPLINSIRTMILTCLRGVVAGPAPLGVKNTPSRSFGLPFRREVGCRWPI